MAFPQDWATGRVCELTIDQVDGGLTAFPVVLTQANLPAEMLDSDDPNCALDGGGDIRFSSDRDGLLQLACDVRAFHTASGGTGAYAELVVATNLSGTGTTTIYLWYHAAGQTQPAAVDTYGRYNAYDGSFVSVFALNEDPGAGGAGEILDRTINQLHGTAHADMQADDLITGNIYKAVRFADPEYIATGAYSHPPTLTLEALLNLTAIDGYDTILFLGAGQGMFVNASPDELRTFPNWTTATGLTLTTGSWTYVAHAADDAEVILQVNGSTDTKAMSGSGGILGIQMGGTSSNAERTLHGSLDEVRVSSVKRSAAWRNATYSNLTAPANFTAAGTPEDATEPVTYDPRWRQWDMGARQVSTTAHPLTFPMVDETDGITGVTGLTVTVTLSKNGAAYAAADGTVSEVGNGIYALAGNATDRSTLGELAVHASATGAKPFDCKIDIVTHDPYDIATGNATLAMQETIDGKLDDVMGVTFVTGTHSLDQTVDTATLVDAVCDENIVSAHGTGNTVGMILRALGAEIAARTNNNTLNDLLGVADQVGATVVTEAGGGGSGDSRTLHSTSLYTVASQTSMRLTTGSTDNDAYNNCLAVFTDQLTNTQQAVCRITDYSGASRTITLEAAPAFIVTVGDSVAILADVPSQLSTAAITAVTAGVLEDDVSARTTASSAGRAINTLTTLGARTNNANLNSLLGVADTAGLTAVRSNYFCRHKFTRDGQADMDEYSCVRWWRDDEPLTTGVTSPTIRVINGKTGADLIAQTPLTEAGSSHLFYYEATGAERIVAGQAYSVVYRATIDGEPRVSEIAIGRDVG